jgi:hypothetical protein
MTRFSKISEPETGGQNEPPRLDAHIRKATETTNWYPNRGAKMDPQIWPGNSTKSGPRSLKNLARKLNKKWSKHHWPAPLASTIDTAGQQHCPLPLVSTAGRHHWPRPLATCSYTSMTMRPTSWKGTLGSTTGQHCWPALFKPVARSTTGQYHRPAAPVAITTGQHHWPTMLANKTGQHHWPSILANHWPAILASTAVQQYCTGASE